MAAPQKRSRQGVDSDLIFQGISGRIPRRDPQSPARDPGSPLSWYLPPPPPALLAGFEGFVGAGEVSGIVSGPCLKVLGFIVLVPAFPPCCGFILRLLLAGGIC